MCDSSGAWYAHKLVRIVSILVYCVPLFFDLSNAQMMIAALNCSSMERLAVVDYFEDMKKDGRLQVLTDSLTVCAL